MIDLFNNPLETKNKRLQETIKLQKRLTEEQGQNYKGKTVEVLIEGGSSKPGYSFKGRNPQYWRVNAKGDKKKFQPGDIIQVNIEKISGHSLSGLVQ